MLTKQKIKEIDDALYKSLDENAKLLEMWFMKQMNCSKAEAKAHIKKLQEIEEKVERNKYLDKLAEIKV